MGDHLRRLRRIFSCYCFQRRVEKGQPDMLDYRVFLSLLPAEAGVEPRLISPWHDVPFLSRRSLPHSQIFHYVNEIPRGYEERHGRAISGPWRALIRP